jgi:muconate cycloisomerase
MKITALELFHISIPFAVPYRLSKIYGTLTDAQAVILKLHTDEGLVGFGEADPMNPFTEETPGTVMAIMRDLIAPRLMGCDPTAINRIEARLDQAVLGHPTARGAVNMALYDILGKVHGVPVHTLLGGKRHDHLPLLGPIGSGSPDEDAVAIETLIRQGYRTVMIKMGALAVGEEIKRMAAAFERFGDRLVLIADANQGWGLKEALVFVDGVRACAPALIEQPIRHGDLRALRTIRNAAPCPISADESLVTVDDAAALLREDAADAFSIKVSKNGGVSKSLTIAKLAEGFGLRCLMNSMLEFGITQAASLQLGCTLDNLLDCGHAYMSVLRMSDDITDFRENIADAVVTVPDRPGLGISIAEEKLKTYTRVHRKIET